jgi:hypothetical protein
MEVHDDQWTCVGTVVVDAVERKCCPFFTLDWEPERRRLTVAVSQAEHEHEHEPAPDAVAFALELSRIVVGDPALTLVETPSLARSARRRGSGAS